MTPSKSVPLIAFNQMQAVFNKCLKVLTHVSGLLWCDLRRDMQTVNVMKCPPYPTPQADLI